MNGSEVLRRQSNKERLRAFFEANPLKWIDARDLEFAGRQAWRTRLSEVRQQFEAEHAGTIENQIQHPFTIERDESGEPVRLFTGGPVISRYRYVPHKVLGRDSSQPTPSLPLFDTDAGPWSR